LTQGSCSYVLNYQPTPTPAHVFQTAPNQYLSPPSFLLLWSLRPLFLQHFDGCLSNQELILAHDDPLLICFRLKLLQEQF